MRRIVVVLGVVAVMAATVALAAGAALAQAETGTLSERITVVEETENPCTGEPVTLEATFHFLTHVTTTEEGGSHVVNHFNIAGRGVSPSGAKYVVVNGDNLIFNWTQSDTEPGTVTATSEGHIMVHRQGENAPEEDFIVRYTFHGTMNANGELTAVVENFETECR